MEKYTPGQTRYRFSTDNPGNKLKQHGQAQTIENRAITFGHIRVNPGVSGFIRAEAVAPNLARSARPATLIPTQLANFSRNVPDFLLVLQFPAGPVTLRRSRTQP
jgi:hypothetical protein